MHALQSLSLTKVQLVLEVVVYHFAIFLVHCFVCPNKRFFHILRIPDHSRRGLLCCQRLHCPHHHCSLLPAQAFALAHASPRTACTARTAVASLFTLPAVGSPCGAWVAQHVHNIYAVFSLLQALLGPDLRSGCGLCCGLARVGVGWPQPKAPAESWPGSPPPPAAEHSLSWGSRPDSDGIFFVWGLDGLALEFFEKFVIFLTILLVFFVVEVGYHFRARTGKVAHGSIK